MSPISLTPRQVSQDCQNLRDLIKKMRVYGYEYEEYVHITGDGACFYNAVSMARYRTKEGQMYVRKEAASLFRDENYIKKVYESHDHLIARLDIKDGSNLEGWIEDVLMRKHAWVPQEDVIQAVASACEISIIIWDNVDFTIYEFSDPTTNQVQPKIFLQYNGYHYDLLRAQRSA